MMSNRKIQRLKKVIYTFKDRAYKGFGRREPMMARANMGTASMEKFLTARVKRIVSKAMKCKNKPSRVMNKGFFEAANAEIAHCLADDNVILGVSR